MAVVKGLGEHQIRAGSFQPGGLFDIAGDVSRPNAQRWLSCAVGRADHALPPVARTRDTPGWFISALVAAIDGAVIHWMQSAGAPALTAASRITRAASTEDFCALGWIQR